MVHNFLNLNCFWLSNNNWVSDLDDDWDLPFNGLNNRLLDDFSDSNDSFMNNWNLDNSFNFFWNLSYHLDNSVDNLLYFSDDVSCNNLFDNDLNFIRFFNDIGHLNNFFNNLRNFNDSLLSLDDDNWLLNNSIDNDVPNFDMVLNLFSSHNLHLFDNFLNNLFYLDDFGDSDNLFNDLLNNDWYFNYLFNNLLDRNDLFFEGLNFSDFSGDVIDDFSNWNSFFHLNDFLNEFFNKLYLWNLSDDFDNLFHHSWYFNSFLNDSFNLDDLLLGSWDDDGDFNRHWNILFNFSNLLNFNDLLNNFLDWHNLRNLHNSVHNLLNDLFDLNDFGDNSKDLKNIIDIDNSHNFLVDHSNNSLINLKSNASSSFDLFKFFKEGFE